jgi:hypothetical protein
MALTASFLRTAGERDRIYVTRSDGSEASWSFPTYGDGLPHDLVHFVVETVFGLSRGFWGRVDGGADPMRINDEANRVGGKDKYAGFGPEQGQLQMAEALASAWYPRRDDQEVLTAIEAAARATGVEVDVSLPRVHEARRALAALCQRWRGLGAKGTRRLAFDAREPRRGLEGLLA